MADEKETIIVEADPTTKRRLEQLAGRDGISMSAWLRQKINHAWHDTFDPRLPGFDPGPYPTSNEGLNEGQQ